MADRDCGSCPNHGCNCWLRLQWALRRVGRLRGQFAPVEKYKLFATTPITDPEAIVDRVGPVHKPVLWDKSGIYRAAVVTFLTYAQDSGLVGEDPRIADALTFEVIKGVLAKRIADQSITRNSAKCLVQCFVGLMKIAFELKEGRFANLTLEQLEFEVYRIRKLKRESVLCQFKKPTKKNPLRANPLPSPATVAVKLDGYIAERHERCLRLLKGANTEKKKAALAVEYRGLTELVHLTFIASRPGDLRKFEVTTTNPRAGVDSTLWKLKSGNFMLRYRPQKTEQNGRKNDVYALWPNRYNFVLETYLTTFRPLLTSKLPLLYPGSGFRMRQYNAVDRGGMRASSSMTKFYNSLSNRVLGRAMNATDFRKLVTNWYFLAGTSGYVAFVLGHSKKAVELTAVEIENYLNLSPDDAEGLFLNVYEQLFKYVEKRQAA